MSRHREFNEPEALEEAMITFWQKGFDETSYDDLVKATGVSRYGLYTAFGDKKEFFLRTLDHYLDSNRQEMLGPLLEKDASLGAIRAHFGRLVEKIDDPERRVGCMLCNTAIELAQFDKDVEDKVHEVFKEFKSAYKRAARNAIDKGVSGPLLEKDASLGAIRAHFGRLVEKIDDPERRVGCMLCNTAIELAQFDKDVEDKVHEVFKEFKSAYKRAARNAIDKGELSGDTTANQVADYLFGLMMGGAMLARSPIERSKIRNFIKTGLAGLK